MGTADPAFDVSLHLARMDVSPSAPIVVIERHELKCHVQGAVIIPAVRACVEMSEGLQAGGSRRWFQVLERCLMQDLERDRDKHLLAGDAC